MTAVVDSVRRVTDVISEISAASAEQTAGIEQINQAIIQMDTVTQQNAALVEEAAAAAEALQGQAANLAGVVSTFNTGGTHEANVTRIGDRRAAQVRAKAPRAAPRRLANAGGASRDEWESF
jgi:methyl-accepting chemotaxis protein